MQRYFMKFGYIAATVKVACVLLLRVLFPERI